MVPREVIDQIRERVNLVRIIEEAVPLKKSGRNFLGLCPFHQEKTPSFTVSETKQLYHCFGCGEGGTAITFLMKFHRLNFPEALDRLASIAGIDLKPYKGNSKDTKRHQEQRQRVLDCISYARDRYHQAFLHSDMAKEARGYVAKRGVRSDTIQRIQIGFAPESWDSLARAMERDGISLKNAEIAGLIKSKKSTGGYFDIFRSRIMFPIQNEKGQTVGFGGRILGEESPKYLNSPQTLVFDKSRLLFGLFEAQEVARKKNLLVVVEGYFDQIALFENGVEYCVATLGTSLSDSHARLLKRYVDEVILVFDGDIAGRNASIRSMKPLLSQGLHARVVFLPQGLDPDSFIRKQGEKAFLKELSQAESLLNYFIREHFQNEEDVSKKAQAIEELSELIKKTENIYLREAFLEDIHQKTGLDKSVLKGKKVRHFLRVEQKEGVVSQKKSSQPQLSMEELTLLRLAAEVPEAKDRMEREGVLSLFSSFKRIEQVKSWLTSVSELKNESGQASALVEAWEEEQTRSELAKIFLDSALDYVQSWNKIWKDCVKKLRNRRVKELAQAVARAETAGDVDQVQKLSLEVQELKRMEFEKHDSKEGML